MRKVNKNQDVASRLVFFTKEQENAVQYKASQEGYDKLNWNEKMIYDNISTDKSEHKRMIVKFGLAASLIKTISDTFLNAIVAKDGCYEGVIYRLRREKTLETIKK